MDRPGQSGALHGPWHIDALQSQEGGYNIDQADHARLATAGWNDARPGDNQRHPRQAVVEYTTLALHAVLAHHITMVRAERDDRPLAQAQIRQRAEDLGQYIIDETDHAIVHAHQRPWT